MDFFEHVALMSSNYSPVVKHASKLSTNYFSAMLHEYDTSFHVSYLCNIQQPNVYQHDALNDRPLMKQLYYYTIHACAMLHETTKLKHFFCILIHQFTTCKWPKWCSFSAFFLLFASPIHDQNGAAWKSFTGHDFKVVKDGTTSLFEWTIGCDFMQNRWWDGGSVLVPRLQSREACRDFTILFLNIIL